MSILLWHCRKQVENTRWPAILIDCRWKKPCGAYLTLGHTSGSGHLWWGRSGTQPSFQTVSFLKVCIPTTPGGSVLFLDFFRNLTDIAVVWWILAHRSREAVLNFGFFSPTADVRKMQRCQWYHNSVEGVSKTPMFYRGVSRAQDSIVYVNTHAPTRTSTAIYLHCLYEYNNWVWHDHVHSCCNYGL